MPLVLCNRDSPAEWTGLHRVLAVKALILYCEELSTADKQGFVVITGTTVQACEIPRQNQL